MRRFRSRCAARTRCRATAGCSTASTASATLLGDLRADADVVIDTSGLNVHQLTAKVAQAFDGAATGRGCASTVMSFGFKYGIPLDADIVVDMRFLPNPYWVPELRPLTGLDARGQRLRPAARTAPSEFLDRLVPLLEPVLAGYLREGKRYVTIAVGCTGGKHRSRGHGRGARRAAGASWRRRRTVARPPRPGARVTGRAPRPGGRRARRRPRPGRVAVARCGC